jgi:hypothetical protein
MKQRETLWICRGFFYLINYIMKNKLITLQNWIEQINPTVLTDKTKKHE